MNLNYTFSVMHHRRFRLRIFMAIRSFIPAAPAQASFLNVDILPSARLLTFEQICNSAGYTDKLVSLPDLSGRRYTPMELDPVIPTIVSQLIPTPQIPSPQNSNPSNSSAIILHPLESDLFSSSLHTTPISPTASKLPPAFPESILCYSPNRSFAASLTPCSHTLNSVLSHPSLPSSSSFNHTFTHTISSSLLPQIPLSCTPPCRFFHYLFPPLKIPTPSPSSSAIILHTLESDLFSSSLPATPISPTASKPPPAFLK